MFFARVGVEVKTEVLALSGFYQPRIEFFQPAPAEGEIALFTRDGRALVFAIDEIRLLPKGRGLKLIAAEPGKSALEAVIPVVDGVAGKLKGERLKQFNSARGGKGKPLRAPRS